MPVKQNFNEFKEGNKDCEWRTPVQGALGEAKNLCSVVMEKAGKGKFFQLC